MIPVAHPHQAHSKRFLSFDSSRAPHTPVQPYGMHLESSYFWWHTDSVKDHQFLQWSRWNPVLLTETSDLSYSHLLPPWIEGNSLKGWFLPFLDSFPGNPPPQCEDLSSLTVRLLLTPLWESGSAGLSLFMNMLLLAPPGFLCLSTFFLFNFHTFLHGWCAYSAEHEVMTGLLLLSF